MAERASASRCWWRAWQDCLRALRRLPEEARGGADRVGEVEARIELGELRGMKTVQRTFGPIGLDLAGTSILVTGGTGSFGRALAKHLLLHNAPRRLVV